MFFSSSFDDPFVFFDVIFYELCYTMPRSCVFDLGFKLIPLLYKSLSVLFTEILPRFRVVLRWSGRRFLLDDYVACPSITWVQFLAKDLEDCFARPSCIVDPIFNFLFFFLV